MLCFYICASAQTDPSPKNIPLKGYYAIGDNYKKLSTGSVPPTDTIITPVIRKGFYSMKNKNKKFSVSARWVHSTHTVPTITKGYYAIGNNAQKLVE